jgi:NADPH-dependent F420 reductase
MRIALLGGTGDIGEGLALRWAMNTDHELVIGSRKPAKAEQHAAKYREQIESRGAKANVSGTGNSEAAAVADIVVLSLPPAHLVDTIKTIADSLTEESILVSPAVSMSRDESGFHYDSPSEADSVTALVAQAAPDGVATVGAFHNLPAGRLTDLDAPLDIDTAIVADDETAAARVTSIAEDIEGLRALRAGPIANAPEVEGITPLLIDLAMNNDGLHDLGVRFD